MVLLTISDEAYYKCPWSYETCESWPREFNAADKFKLLIMRKNVKTGMYGTF